MANSDLDAINVGKLTPESVSKMADNLGDLGGLSDASASHLKDQLGSKLAPLLDLDPEEVKMLDALPIETIESMFHACARAIATGGKIEYQRSETGGPRMEIHLHETVDHKPEGGGGPKAKAHAKVHCLK